VTHDNLELVERARRHLKDNDLPFAIAGGVAEAEIVAAEAALETGFPPSYRSFLRRFGALTLPPRASTIHQFVGLGSPSVVDRTTTARVENRLPESLVIVAIGADGGEWFCLDTSCQRSDGECPVMLFDARDNQLDQQFYEDFGQMLGEVLTFVMETLDEAPAVGAGDDDEPRALSSQG